MNMMEYLVAMKEICHDLMCAPKSSKPRVMIDRIAGNDKIVFNSNFVRGKWRLPTRRRVSIVEKVIKMLNSKEKRVEDLNAINKMKQKL